MKDGQLFFLLKHIQPYFYCAKHDHKNYILYKRIYIEANHVGIHQYFNVMYCTNIAGQDCQEEVIVQTDTV